MPGGIHRVPPGSILALIRDRFRATDSIAGPAQHG
jgi:hypothetical protein